MRRARLTEDTRRWVHAVVGSGLGTAEETREQVLGAINADLDAPDPERLADAWIAAARQDWLEAAQTWPAVTDHDRLQQAFLALERGEIVVLQGGADHWSAHEELARADPSPRGIVWFTASDVWHAVEEGMLEINLWHPSTANAAPGDVLLEEVLAAFAGAGLAARFDEGRIEVAAHWQRRPPVCTSP